LVWSRLQLRFQAAAVQGLQPWQKQMDDQQRAAASRGAMENRLKHVNSAHFSEGGGFLEAKTSSDPGRPNVPGAIDIPPESASLSALAGEMFSPGASEQGRCRAAATAAVSSKVNH